MTTKTNNFEINGIIDPSSSVIDNLNLLATSAGSWITFDALAGKWSVIINRAGDSIKSFTESNITGGVSVSGTGVTELYNGVSVSFPNKDLRDQIDYVEYEIPVEDRFPNEQES